jgi:hypothetical protein
MKDKQFVWRMIWLYIEIFTLGVMVGRWDSAERWLFAIWWVAFVMYNINPWKLREFLKQHIG